MPCYDGGPSCTTSYESDYRRERKAKERTEAMLCAVLSVLEYETTLTAVLDDVDYTEAGFKRAHLEAWWKEHKVLDAKRRVREAKERDAAKKAAETKAKAKKAREAALAKLSEADRKALGLK
jgi:hypothetical protein